MTKHEIEFKVKEILSRQLNLPAARIGRKARLVEDLGMTPQDFYEIYGAVLDKFDAVMYKPGDIF